MATHSLVFMVQLNHGLRLNLKRDQERIERQLLQGLRRWYYVINVVIPSDSLDPKNIIGEVGCQTDLCIISLGYLSSDYIRL